MKSFKRENQIDMEQVLVAGCDGGGLDQSLAIGSLVTNSTALNLMPNQLGILSWDFDGTVKLGDYITPGTTVQDVAAIKIVQGTPASTMTQYADPWEVNHKAYVETGVIYACNVRSVTVKKCKPGKWSNNSFTDFSDTCLTCCGQEFCIKGCLSSARNDRDFGKTGGPGVNASVEVPDFTTCPEIVSPLDYTLQNLLANLNLNSRLTVLSNPGLNQGGGGDYVALAINTAGGAGTPIGSITCGTPIPFMKDSYATCDDCGDPQTPLTSQFNATIEFMRSLACTINEHASNPAMVNPITGASTIEVLDLATAGSADNVNSFIVFGLPQEPVGGTDCFSGSDIKATCTSIDVDVCGGFAKDKTLKRCCCHCEEGVGKGRDWKIEENRRHLMHTSSMWVDTTDGSSIGTSYVDSSKYYTSYIIDYYDHEETLTVQEQSPKQAVLLFCCGWDCASTTVDSMAANLAADNPDIDTITSACCNNCSNGVPVASANTVPDVQASLDTWLESSRPHHGFSVKCDATAGGPYLV